MTNRLEALEDWVAGMLGQLEPVSRNKLARSIGQELRRSQQQRIINQQNSDRTRYAPRRKRNLRSKQSRVKRKVKMFQKLRTSRFLKIKCDTSAISVGFAGRVARIARVHQYGLRDSAEPGARATKYDRRELLAFTDADVDFLRDRLLKHLTKQK
ncbi:phage virion morphogenesis protein [Pseudomonas sp. 22082]|uniref:phage virion morphogenesis protein n=1 Tax=Pseudomonas sp. 22082 TaxID=3453868 RepID=UPI003F872C82